MKYIYFHIDEFNRDAITASVLKNEFKKRGWLLIYGNRVTARVLKYFEWAFDAIILPKPTFIRSIFGYDTIKTLRSRYVMLYTENIGIIANDVFPKMVLKGALDEEFMSGKTFCVDKVSAFCFWGEQVSEVVKNTYESIADRCYVVGHPRHDARALTRNEKRKNTIGIISRYCTLNDYFSRHPIETIFDRYTKKNLYEYYNTETQEFLEWERRGANPENDLFLEAIDIKNTILIIIGLNEAGYKVSFKIHPRENISTWVDVFNRHNLDVEVVDSTKPFTLWALQQNCVIGSPSTSFYDCLMVGVLPINISNINSDRRTYVSRLYEENNKLMPYIESPRSIEDLLFLVKNIDSVDLSTPEILSVLKAEANYPECQKSGTEIANVLAHLFQTPGKKPPTFKIAIYFYKLSCIILHIKIFISRAVGRGTVNSASFLLTRSVAKEIDKMVFDEVQH